MPNKELFRKIRDQINADPNSHNQGAWEFIGGCGTSRCIAGWAIHLTYPDQSVFTAALDRYPHLSMSEAVERLAKGLLDISGKEARTLFYAGDFEACELVDRYAE